MKKSNRRRQQSQQDRNWETWGRENMHEAAMLIVVDVLSHAGYFMPLADINRGVSLMLAANDKGYRELFRGTSVEDAEVVRRFVNKWLRVHMAFRQAAFPEGSSR